MNRVGFKNGVFEFNDVDTEYLKAVVRPAAEVMETHMEIFDLPSGKTLNLWCDMTADVISPEKRNSGEVE
jgi:hypothetical protein